MGDEPYFHRLADRPGSPDAILPPEAERAFGQAVVYGKESEAGAVINLCRQMPMIGTPTRS